MKVLYIGHYTENSGWAKSAIDQILALDYIGVDVVCKPVRLTYRDNYDLPERILELQDKSMHDVTHCIQHVLPHHLVGTQKFEKNIAYFLDEMIHLKKHYWHYFLDLMDEIFVPNQQMKNNLQKFIDKKISYVPQACNVDKISKLIDISEPEVSFNNIRNLFKFYLISDLNDRKNIIPTIKAYCSEFTKLDQVVLILKVNKFGVSPEHLRAIVNKQIISPTLSTMRLNQDLLPPIITITENFSETQIYDLHRQCDCYVHPTHGEGWSIPSFEAMCFGKTPICSNEGGPSEFIDKNNKNTGTLIDGVLQIPFSRDPAFQFIQTGNEAWFEPSEIEIKKSMRYYYENRTPNCDGLERGKMFSYNNVGNTMKELLHEHK
jgi:glycosyltransferase involved in cell wall biosynthesis